MESQDAGIKPKPLTFENMEDIRDIDSEDTSPSAADDVTDTYIASAITDQGDTNTVLQSLSVPKENGNAGEVEETIKSSSSNGEFLRLDSSVNESDKPDYDDDKIQEESSCTDDTSLNPRVSNAQGDGEQPDECVTHLFSFTFRPEVPKEGSASKEETESSVGESKMTESQASLTESQASLTSQDSTLKVKSKTKKVKKVANKDGRDSDSSVSSRKRGKTNKTRIKSKFAPGSFEYIEERLRGQIFSGWIEERKWVETLAGYRDVIEIDEWEVDMNKMLMCVIRSIPGVLEGTKWINITPPSDKEPCYCLWTLLPTPPNPGHYWFSVTGVAVHPQFGLRVMLKIIRSIHPHDGELARARRKRRKELALRGPGHELETLSEQVQDWLQQMKQINLSSIWSAVSSTITISNIREAFRFVIVLSMTLVVGLVAFVRESHHYGIQFLHAAGVFFRNITPFLQSLLAFAEKIIGGMYLLIAMVYNDFRRSSVRQPPPHPSMTRPPMAIVDSQGGFSPVPTGPRTVKYVPPEQWVYKSQNSPATDS